MNKRIVCLCLLLSLLFTAQSLLPAGLETALADEPETVLASEDSPAYTEEAGEEEYTLAETESGLKENKTGKYVIYNGNTLKLKVKTSKKIKWTSSSPKVAKVSSSGLVTALKVGTANIWARFGSKSVKFQIVVKSPLSVSAKSVSLKMNQSKSVTCTFHKSGKLTYKIADTSVVKAQWGSWNAGKIKLKLTGLKKGSTTVTITNSATKDKVRIKVKVTGSAASDAVYRALLVGNSNYPVNSLPNHKWDVRAMKGLLTSSLTTKYKVTCKYDAKASSILSGISSAFKGATSRDVSLFYFGGHGMANSGALCGVDNNTVSPAQLRNALLKVPGKVIVILECCHSGAYVTAGGETPEGDALAFNRAVVDAFSGYTYNAPNDDPESNKGELRSEKFIVLTACQMYEESWNFWYYGTSADQSFGTFTKTMFNGLGCAWSSGKYSGRAPCDTNRDGIASLGECQKYIYDWASKLNIEMGVYNYQHCMSYGPSSYPLFRLKK